MTKNTLNILQIINEPWTSGVTEYGLILSKGLKKCGHNVIIVGLRNTPVEEFANRNDIKFELIKNIRDVLKRENIDVINAHRADGYVRAVLANKLAGGRAVLIRTRCDQRLAKNNFFNRYLYRSLTDKIIVPSQMAKENHFAGFDIEDKIRVIHPAVDTDIFNPKISGEKFRANYGIRKDEYLVGIIGRLDPVKGHYYFFEAASRLKDVLPFVKYAVIGQEENIKFEQLRQIVESFGLQGKVIFTGFYQNVSEAIAGIDIGVIASIGSEAVSRVCLEMMACGKPVIASRVGSIPEMISDGESGLLYNQKDSNKLSEHIKRLILDPALIKKMGRNAYLAVIDKFSVDNLVKRTEEVYFEDYSDNNMHE